MDGLFSVHLRPSTTPIYPSRCARVSRRTARLSQYPICRNNILQDSIETEPCELLAPGGFRGGTSHALFVGLIIKTALRQTLLHSGLGILYSHHSSKATFCTSRCGPEGASQHWIVNTHITSRTSREPEGPSALKV